MRNILKKFTHRGGIIVLCEDGTLHGWHPVNQCFFPLPENTDADPGEVPDDSDDYRANLVEQVADNAAS